MSVRSAVPKTLLRTGSGQTGPLVRNWDLVCWLRQRQLLGSLKGAKLVPGNEPCNSLATQKHTSFLLKHMVEDWES